VCPVGTLLGMASGIGGWRLEIDHSRCRKCGDCLRVCKAQCIDLRAGTIDNSRCIACYNCIGACEEFGIQHRFKWKPSTAGSNTTAAQNSVHGSSGPATPRSNSRQVVANPNSGDAPPAYPSRRAFLTTTAAALTAAGGLGAAALTEAADTAGKPSCPTRRVPISPPGTGSIERFLDRCTACQLCVSVCPTHVLQPSFLEYGLAGIMKPHLDFERSFCNFECTSCGDICPDGAILRLAPADKKLTCIGVADIDYDKCIVKTNGTDCAACSEHCPTQAVSTVPYGNNLRLPQMHRGLCIGCGACEYACPVRPARAITVSAKLVHTRARRKVESPAINPSSGSDFPF
jgi:ferredoxin